jgi:hypothetical protein
MIESGSTSENQALTFDVHHRAKTETYAGRHETILFFITPVWGVNHLNLFIDVGIPSLLASGNLPSVSKLRACRYLIYTRADDEERLRGAEVFGRLKAILPIEIHLIGEPLSDSPHRIMSNCHVAALHQVDSEDGAAVFIPPDCVWANGSMVNLERLVDCGKSVVHISGIRLDRDSVLPRLRDQFDPETCSLEIGARTLVSLALASLHPIAKLHFWNEFDGGLMPANLYWTVAGEGLALRCFHLHPLMVKAQIKCCRFQGTIDDDLALFACPDQGGDYVVTDSDEILVFELSGPERIISGSYEKGSVDSVAAWMEVGANARHRFLATHPIRIHGGQMTESKWKPIEENGEVLIASLSNINRSSSLMLALRHPSVLLYRDYAMSLGLGKYSGRVRPMSRSATRALYRIVQAAHVMSVVLFGQGDKRLDPVAASVYRRLGDVKRRLGFLKSAIRDYGAAIDCSPASPALHFLRGAVLLQLREKTRAAEEFKAALLLDPKNNTLLRFLRIAQGIDPEQSSVATYYQRRGSIKRKLRLFESAISDYGKAIKDSPMNPDLYLLRGRILLQRHELTRAADDFESGLALDPGDGVLLDLLKRARGDYGS